MALTHARPVQVGTRPARLVARRLLFVPSGELHAVSALQPSSALVTIALRR